MTTTTPAELRAKAAALIDEAQELEKKPITRDDLAQMGHEEINSARRAGRLDHLMNPTKENK